MTVTIGIIGYGRIAEHHDMAISAHPDLRVGFVCDLNADRRTKADRPRERKVFVSLNEALVNSAAMGNEWAVVCTPSGAHYHHALLCIEAGYNVLLEKPPTMSSREFEGLVDFAECKGLHLVPVFQNRFNTAWTKARDLIRSGAFGDFRFATLTKYWHRPQRYYDLSPWRGTLSYDGGSIVNQGIHDVDLLIGLTPPIERVQARQRTFDRQVEVDTFNSIILDHQGNGITTIINTTNFHEKDKVAGLLWVGSQGYIELGGISFNQILDCSLPDISNKYDEDFSDNVYGNGHQALYKNLFALSHEKQHQFVRELQEDAKQTLKILEAIYESNQLSAHIEMSDYQPSQILGLNNQELDKIYEVKRG